MIQQIAVIYSELSMGSSGDAAQAVQSQHPDACIWFRTKMTLEEEIRNPNLSALEPIRQEERSVNAGQYIVRYRLIDVQLK